MSTKETKITVDNTLEVNEYACLRHKIKLEKDNESVKIIRQVKLGWAAHDNLIYIFRTTATPIKLKSLHVCDDIWNRNGQISTKKNVDRLRNAETTMGRTILGIRFRNRVRNEEIRRRTKATGMILGYLSRNGGGKVI